MAHSRSDDVMKIILYTYDIMKIGGIETSFFHLAQYLKDQGYDVGVRYSVIAPMQQERYKAAGIDVSMVKSEVCDILFIGSVWRRPKQVIAKLVVQQVHADWSDPFWGDNNSAPGLIKSADKECDIFAAVSESSASYVRKYTNKEVIVMNNLAPSQTKIKRNKNNRIVIGAFTRMSTEKGLSNYEALRDRLKEIAIDAELRVYTNGDTPNGWTAYDPVPDIRTELPHIDFVASLADTESFGYTIAESNSCGVPCIIKRTNSTGEFFDSADNIILSDISELNKSDIKNTSVFSYTLRKSTEKSVDSSIIYLESLTARKCTIKCMRGFRDIKAGKQRRMGELFTVSAERAAELLNHELNIVEVYDAI